MNMKRILAFLLLASICFPSLLGQYGTGGEVHAKPLIYQGAVVVPSDDGNLYALNPNTMALVWKRYVGTSPNEVILFDNALVASTTGGKIAKVGAGGNLLWSADLNVSPYNASYVYGADANEDGIYVSADSGIFLLNKDGAVESVITSFDSEVVTAPAAGPDNVIFGKDDELVNIGRNGVTRWAAQLEGMVWLSRPVMDGSLVYIGSLDNKMHAFSVSSGFPAWEFSTRNWVLSTAHHDDNRVYFGSNDGKVYSVDKGSGQLDWQAQTQLAIQSEPESGYMGGVPVVFVGGSDKSIYAISKDGGRILWKGPADGVVGSPLYYQNTVIVGSSDQKIYSFSTERACSITTIHDGDLVGLKELTIGGNYVSESGGATVYFNINSAGWEEAETTEDGWIAFIDPSERLNAGLNTISCRVVDAGGEETGSRFTSVSINHDPTSPLSQLVVTVSPNILEGEAFTIFVNDNDDGSPVRDFEVKLDEQTYSGDANASITINEPGSYKIIASKMGFKDRTVNINVNAKGVNPFIIGGGVLLILIIVWQVWSRFLGAKFAKKKR